MPLTATEQEELQRLTAAFEEAGGRGVDLAERIDTLRAKDTPDVTPYFGAPLTTEFVRGYALGYFYGRAEGDEDPLRTEMVNRYGVSDESNMAQYEGAKTGYADGVNDYIAENDGEA